MWRKSAAAQSPPRHRLPLVGRGCNWRGADVGWVSRWCVKRVVLARAVWKILGVEGIVDFLSVRGLRAACVAKISFGDPAAAAWCDVTKGIQVRKRWCCLITRG